MASLSSLTEAALGLILIMLCIGIIIGYMNINYSKTYDSSFGINVTGDLDRFNDYQGTLQTGMKGEAETNAVNGLSLATAWGIILGGVDAVIKFVTGQWISNAIGLMQLGTAGDYLALILRILLIFSIGFIMIKILFKIKP
jgi:hypothetical protein